MDEATNSRHIDENILSTLNLKILDNFDDYIVLIIGIDDREHFIDKLPMMVKYDYLQSFDDIEKSSVFIDSQSDIDIFLIISGTLGKKYHDEILNKTQIRCVYIYCKNENYHKDWANKIKTIRCITSDPTDLIRQLHQDAKLFSSRWPFEEKSFVKSSIPTSQWYHLFLTMICYRPDTIKLSYDSTFNECREYYKNNQSILKQINRLSQNYKSTHSIEEYTRDSFFYRILNHALRTQNIRLIRIFSPFIRDLHFQLSKLCTKYYGEMKDQGLIRSIYRGQYLTVEQVNHIYSVWKSNHPVLTMTTFCSTSRDPDIALNFIPPTNGVISCLFEIVITDDYNYVEKGFFCHEQVFADISFLSDMVNEREVLFSLVTHFSIKNIENSNDSLLLITLQLAKSEEMQSSFSAHAIIDEFEKLKDGQVYHDIINMLEITANDQTKFDNTNWTIWWNNLRNQWHQGLRYKSPLNLIFYGCFTNNLYWSREAIDMQKDLLFTISIIKSNRSNFQNLYKLSHSDKTIPVRWIAFYEQYLEQFCTTNTNQIINTLKTAAEMYKKIDDRERAKSCYEKILQIITNNDAKIKCEIEKEIKNLKTSFKLTKNNEKKSEIHFSWEDTLHVYEMQRHLSIIYKSFKDCTTNLLSTEDFFRKVDRLLPIISEWYDTVDSRIILRLPLIENQRLSVNDYRFYCVLSVRKYISIDEMTTRDGSNNFLLTLRRYKRYMYDFIFLEQLKYLLIFNGRLSCQVRRIDQLMKKLKVLITMCTIYLCIESGNDTVKMNNIHFINMIDNEMKQHVFADLLDQNSLFHQKSLEKQNFISNETYNPIPDNFRETYTDITTQEITDVFSDP
ncbi:hypothetical protein I4U23_010861 [Adineta vaga]|nr:hypothetical protein I4U23_010861 [Adineta vaga]